MTTIIYWFRNDLRIKDNPAFTQACNVATHLLPIYIHSHSKGEFTEWGFPRFGEHSQKFLHESLSELQSQLAARGSTLIEFSGNPIEIFQNLRDQLQSNIVYCEQIQVPEEMLQVELLKNVDFEVHQFWQSSMLNLKDLPFSFQNMPDIFTRFRQDIERAGMSHADPIESPKEIPPLPVIPKELPLQQIPSREQNNSDFKGGELSALAHISQYFERRLPDTYKETRNQLMGMDYSSKFSPWLAFGCCSARTIVEMLRNYECTYGANDGTYWLWFELLWRDYFRFLHFKYGKRLYFSRGLSQNKVSAFNEKNFQNWSAGNTGQDFIDAGMRQLNQTGYLSNRMRQVVASYWIYDMQGDWRVGAAWFESQLIDYDAYSNQGNWLYIAGRGTDPRGGRPFNVKKQTQDHDPTGDYRAKWL